MIASSSPNPLLRSADTGNSVGACSAQKVLTSEELLANFFVAVRNCEPVAINEVRQDLAKYLKINSQPELKKAVFDALLSGLLETTVEINKDRPIFGARPEFPVMTFIPDALVAVFDLANTVSYAVPPVQFARIHIELYEYDRALIEEQTLCYVDESASLSKEFDQYWSEVREKTITNYQKSGVIAILKGEQEVSDPELFVRAVIDGFCDAVLMPNPVIEFVKGSVNIRQAWLGSLSAEDKKISIRSSIVEEFVKNGVPAGPASTALHEAIHFFQLCVSANWNWLTRKGVSSGLIMEDAHPFVTEFEETALLFFISNLRGERMNNSQEGLVITPLGKSSTAMQSYRSNFLERMADQYSFAMLSEITGIPADTLNEQHDFLASQYVREAQSPLALRGTRTVPSLKDGQTLLEGTLGHLYGEDFSLDRHLDALRKQQSEFAGELNGQGETSDFSSLRGSRFSANFSKSLLMIASDLSVLNQRDYLEALQILVIKIDQPFVGEQGLSRLASSLNETKGKFTDCAEIVELEQRLWEKVAAYEKSTAVEAKIESRGEQLAKKIKSFPDTWRILSILNEAADTTQQDYAAVIAIIDSRLGEGFLGKIHLRYLAQALDLASSRVDGQVQTSILAAQQKVNQLLK